MEQRTPPSATGFAPYEPPEVGRADDARPPRVFYDIDSRRVTLREYSWSSWGSVLPAAVLKLLRVKLPSATDDPNVEGLAPFELLAEDVPRKVLQRLSVLLQQLKTLGFHSPIWHVIEDDVHHVTTYLATLRDDTGRVWARVHHRVWSASTPPKTKLYCELVSEIAGGSYLWSLSSKADLAAPPSCTILRDVDATPHRLLARHRSELRLIGVDKAVPADSPDALRAAVERHHAVVRDFHLSRGVFVPLTGEQREMAKAFRTSMESAEEIGSRHPEILAEVDRIQNQKASRGGGLLLLLATAALFVGASVVDKKGVGGFPAGLLVIIVGVLFFHELGHWVAMRTFGYRNLKMFFIPFFGAAVSGRHYNVPGWKKVIVSLMGPLPGILVGGALGALGVRMNNHVLVQISLTALLLNGFNLLPILPLDGGWVVQAIFFSRHHLLELAFRIATIIGLAVASGLTNDPILRYLAIGMAVSLPAMHRIATITNALRREKLPVASSDGQRLPQPAADVIVDRVKAAFPKKTSNKVAAQHTLQIFENLNARPPGFLASIAFASVQFGSIAGAAVAASFIFVLALRPHTTPLNASTIAVARTPGDSLLTTPRYVVVATFEDGERISPALVAVSRAATPAMAVERLGSTILVSVPLEDVDGVGDIQSRLESSQSKVFVAQEDQPARMRLSCTTSSIARAAAIQRELAPYLTADELDLVPPWKADAAWSADDRARYARARSTFLALTRLANELPENPQVQALAPRMTAALKSGDTAQIGRIRKEYSVVVATSRHDRIAAMRAESGADTALIDAFARSQAAADSARATAAGDADDEESTADARTDTLAAARRALLGPMLGQLPLVEGRATTESAQWSAAGFVGVKDSTVTMSGLRFTNLFQGAPALTRWLLGKGCVGMTYRFDGGNVRASRERAHP